MSPRQRLEQLETKLAAPDNDFDVEGHAEAEAFLLLDALRHDDGVLDEFLCQFCGRHKLVLPFDTESAHAVLRQMYGSMARSIQDVTCCFQRLHARGDPTVYEIALALEWHALTNSRKPDH